MFLHPRDSRVFEADVDPDTTGGTCIKGLIESKFLEPAPRGRPYALEVTRTGQQVLAPTTMRDAAVQEKDSLAVNQIEQGASHRLRETLA